MRPRQRAVVGVLFGLCTCVGVGAAPVAAQDMNTIDDGIFKSADLNSDGEISRREIIHFTDLVFLSVDANNDDILSLEEFIEWDPGYSFLAAQAGKTEQLNSAKEQAYTQMDLNGDGSLDHAEYSAAALYYFYRSDTDNDSTLSQDEFINEFQMLKTIRSALE